MGVLFLCRKLIEGDQVMFTQTTYGLWMIEKLFSAVGKIGTLSHFLLQANDFF